MNIKYLLIVIALVVIAGGGIFTWQYLKEPGIESLEETKTPKEKSTITEEEKPKIVSDDRMKIVLAVNSAFMESDWITLYELVSSTLTNTMAQEEFVASFSTQEEELGRVTAVEVLSEPDEQLNQLGIRFFTVRTRVTLDKDGKSETGEFVDHYVLEEGEWKFWFSDSK